MSEVHVLFPVRPQSAPRVPRGDLPDYLPARMVNEFVYCPRLYFSMWVEGLKVIAKLDLVEAEGLAATPVIISTVLRRRLAMTARLKCGQRIACN